MSIADLRKNEVDYLAHFKARDPSGEDLREARRIMCSYYRLCGLSRRNLYLANNANTANLKSTARSEKRELLWFERLRKSFSDLYGLDLVYTSYYPRIGRKTAGNGFQEVIYTHFYD